MSANSGSSSESRFPAASPFAPYSSRAPKSPGSSPRPVIPARIRRASCRTFGRPLASRFARYVMSAQGQRSWSARSSSANMYAVSFLAFMIATPLFPEPARAASLPATRCLRSPREGSIYGLQAAPRRRSTSFAIPSRYFWRSSSSAEIHPASAAGSRVAITPSMFSGYPAWISIAMVGVETPERVTADLRSSPMIMETQVPTTAIR